MTRTPGASNVEQAQDTRIHTYTHTDLHACARLVGGARATRDCGRWSLSLFLPENVLISPRSLGVIERFFFLADTIYLLSAWVCNTYLLIFLSTPYCKVCAPGNQWQSPLNQVNHVPSPHLPALNGAPINLWNESPRQPVNKFMIRYFMTKQSGW